MFTLNGKRSQKANFLAMAQSIYSGFTHRKMVDLSMVMLVVYWRVLMFIGGHLKTIRPILGGPYQGS